MTSPLKHATKGRKAGRAQGILLLIASALPVMGVVLLSPVAHRLPEVLGPGPDGISLAPIVLTAPALAIALFSALGGYLADFYGRRVCLLTALFVYSFLGTAPLWLDNAYAIIGSRFGLGMAEAVIMASSIALIGDYFEGPTRDRWVAYMMAVSALSATFFYIIGGILGGITWKFPFAAYGMSLIIFLAAVPIIFEPDNPRRKGSDPVPGKAGRPRGLPLPMIAVLMATFFGSILFYIVPLQMGGFLSARDVSSSAQIGVLIAIASLGNPLGSFSFRYLRALPFAPMLVGSTALAGAGLLLAALWPGVPALVIGAFINQMGCGILCPLTMAAVLRLAPAHRRGTSGGSWSSAFFVGQFFSPMVVLYLMSFDIRSGGLMPLVIANAVFAVIAYATFSRMSSRSLASQDDIGPLPMVKV
ncbi:MFS transporter (plasmid) [Novosphingobium resinovorum]|uniref:MFS transporter n=1 Tax=Novosphingobium TaxID=165696 RepID=UPI001B3C953E|nr:MULTISPECIES: MFS transporter [Novosphingobium]MBF7015293.1 MFS transporter [Novosphingobium sp. HR1a]WJM29971.1 MFS transporter [Novosphingobium resinovorum]